MLHKVSEILNVLVSRHPEKHRYWTQWLKCHWDQIAGMPMGEHSWPLKIDRKTLIVGVDSSVWNQALFIHKKDLMVNIKRNTQESIVEDIKCRVVEKPVPWPIPKEQAAAENAEEILDEESEMQIRKDAEKRCECIKDLQLKELLEKITIDFLVFQRTKQGGCHVPDSKP